MCTTGSIRYRHACRQSICSWHRSRQRFLGWIRLQFDCLFSLEARCSMGIFRWWHFHFSKRRHNCQNTLYIDRSVCSMFCSYRPLERTCSSQCYCMLLGYIEGKSLRLTTIRRSWDLSNLVISWNSSNLCLPVPRPAPKDNDSWSFERLEDDKIL